MLSHLPSDDTQVVKPPPFGLILILGAFASLSAMVLESMPASAADPGLALSQASAGIAEPAPVAGADGLSVTKPSPEPESVDWSPTAIVTADTNGAAAADLADAPEPTPVPQVASLPDGVNRRQSQPLQGIAEFEQTLLDDMNAARGDEGVAPLVRNEDLDGVALARARNLVELGYFDHYAPDGTSAFSELAARGLPYYIAGENLARNNYPPNQTVLTAFEGLMASPGHRANILEPRYGAVGVAAVRDGNVWLYVTVFTNPR
jgi:uncharacterized protein YkwD